MDLLRKLYVKFARSKWNIITIIIVYLIMFLIPLYYTINHNLKPETRLYRTTGVFHKINIPCKGSIIRLTTPEGDKIFSCPSPFGFYNYLPVRDDKLHFAEGMLATINWYNKKIYIEKMLITLLS